MFTGDGHLMLPLNRLPIRHPFHDVQGHILQNLIIYLLVPVDRDAVGFMAGIGFRILVYVNFHWRTRHSWQGTVRTCVKNGRIFVK